MNNSTSQPKPRITFSAPELFVIIGLLVVGTFCCFWIPVGGGFDEEQHLIRVWEMSAWQFIPNDVHAPQLPFPAIYHNLSLVQQPFRSILQPEFLSPDAHLSLGADDYIYGYLTTYSSYSPPLLLPQALVMRYLGRRFGLPALDVLYACRLAGLLSYLLLAWLAVRLVPFGKWPLAILAISPMAIYQAATVTADTISNGIGLLFIGGCLAVAA
jgi:hypothetical protein